LKIAYWSPVHGQTGTTSNILATSLMAGLEFRKKSILTQTHFNYNNLEAPLVGINSKQITSTDYFRDIGLDMLLRSFKSFKLDRESIYNCCISLPGTNVSLLPGTYKCNKDSFEYEMNSIIINLLRTMEEFSEIVFIDINSGNNPISLKIITDADLTIINLSQNMSIIDTLLSTGLPIPLKKAFFLFGNYNRKSKYNIHNIRRRFHKYITSSNSGVIPYNTAYLDAQCDGKVIELIRDNRFKDRNDENDYFISQVKTSTGKILKKAGLITDITAGFDINMERGIRNVSTL
jgi:hypothetical protein